MLGLKAAEVTKFWTGIKATLSAVGFTEEQVALLAPRWVKRADVFQSRYKDIDDAITAASGRLDRTADAGPDTIAGVEAAIKTHEEGLQLDKTNKDKVLAIEKQRLALTEEKRRLDADQEWVEKTYQAERQAAQTRRVDSYLLYFELLKEERDVLNDLYAPLKRSLAAQGTHERKLEFVCRIQADLPAWLARGAELFDLRKTGTFRYDMIEQIAEAELAKAWHSGDPESIRAALGQCLATIRETDVLRTQLKTGFQPRNVAKWLFGVDHIAVTYGIQYEGKDLRLLSPGTKGIVLLILYLSVDRFDTRPLIVDQPDENLDNLSTYEILRPYFREAKKRRQIIIITHNPNLVVNTDAEQVIVADSALRPNGLPQITYSYGSLEASVMDGPLQEVTRSAVCRIMEGGKTAFRKREKRYGHLLS